MRLFEIYKSRNFVKNGNTTAAELMNAIYKSRNFVKNGNFTSERFSGKSTRVEIL